MVTKKNNKTAGHSIRLETVGAAPEKGKHMTGVGRPEVITDFENDERVEAGARQDAANSQPAGSMRDMLIAQGAPALADILMRGSRASPELASELARIRHGGPPAALRRNLTLPCLAEARARAERDAVHEALEACGFNITRAASQLGISRVTIYKLMDRYGLRRQRAGRLRPPGAQG